MCKKGLFSILALDQRLEYDCRQRAAYEGCDQEYPVAAQRVAALEDRGTEGTGRVDGGAGEVDTEDVHQRQGEADDQTGELLILLLGGHAQDDQNEYEGQDALDDQRLDDAVVVQTIRAEACVKADQCAQYSRSRGSAGKLRDDVEEELGYGHAAGQQNADRDRRVDVAAGYVADGVRHRDDHQTERQRREDVRAVRLSAVAAYYRSGTAREQYQHEGADEFRTEFFDVVHVFLSFNDFFRMT